MVTNSVFGASSREIGELFADYLEGDSTRPALAISSSSLGETAVNAIVKSLDACGYPPESCTFAQLLPKSSHSGRNDVPLDPQALFLLIEGLDPVFVVVTDEGAARTLATSYRIELPLNASTRAFGRPCAAFENLDKMLTSQPGKQAAWHVFKATFSTK